MTGAWTPTPWQVIPPSSTVLAAYPTTYRINFSGTSGLGESIGYTHKLRDEEQSEANPARLVACVNAFHSPSRTIATENIPEGLFWEMWRLLHLYRYTGPFEGRPTTEEMDQDAGFLLASLKIEEGQ